LVEALSNMEAYCDVCTSGPEVCVLHELELYIRFWSTY